MLSRNQNDIHRIHQVVPKEKTAFRPADSATRKEYGQTDKRNRYHYRKIKTDNDRRHVNSGGRNNTCNPQYAHQVANIAADDVAHDNT